jgi:FkbM family methyltransferase
MIKNVIKSLLRKLFYPDFVNKLDVIQNYCTSNDNIFFIQIGANDGIDEITEIRRMYNWKGLMVEPIPSTFNNMILLNQSDLGIIFENVAISKTTTKRTIYRIAISNLKWATALTSFNSQIIIDHIENGFVKECAEIEGIILPNDINDIISTETVQGITFHDLLRKHNIINVDILLIDTEGYDYEILKQIDFKRIQPSIIIYEHKHLKKCIHMISLLYLKFKGYKVFIDSADTIAVKV